METVNIQDLIGHYKAVRLRLAQQTQAAIKKMKAAERAEKERIAAANQEKQIKLAAEAERARRLAVQIREPWRAIMLEVAQKHHIEPAVLMSADRHKLVAYARHELCWRLSRELGMSLPQIGRKIGRDHTTVLHAIRAHAKRSGYVDFME